MGKPTNNRAWWLVTPMLALSVTGRNTRVVRISPMTSCNCCTAPSKPNTTNPRRNGGVSRC